MLATKVGVLCMHLIRRSNKIVDPEGGTHTVDYQQRTRCNDTQMKLTIVTAGLQLRAFAAKSCGLDCTSLNVK